MAFNIIQRNTVTGQQGVYGSVVAMGEDTAEDVRFYADQACKQANQFLSDNGKHNEYCFVEPVAIAG